MDIWEEYYTTKQWDKLEEAQKELNKFLKAKDLEKKLGLSPLATRLLKETVRAYNDADTWG